MIEKHVPEAAQEIKPEISNLPIRSVGVVIIKDDKVLMVRGWDGTTAGEGVYGFPAGRIKEDQIDREVAVYKLKAETGLETEIEALEKFPENHFTADLNLDNNGVLKHASLDLFVCNNYQGDLNPYTVGMTAEWVLIKNLYLTYPTMPNVLEAINNVNKYLSE
jgi:ADP-ribose pyrophosphatase YjhB (NUDIX family)